jgi:DNA mismatch endonuclease (patch repair protein)
MAGEEESWASSPEVRVRMRAIRRVDTKPEIRLRQLLHAAGLRIRKDHRLDLPGGRVRPDIVFTRRKVAVFVDSCFWHCCPQHGRQPTVNEWYWGPKLARNVARDRKADALLGEQGWQAVRVWEHVDLADAARMIEDLVRDQAPG